MKPLNPNDRQVLTIVGSVFSFVGLVMLTVGVLTARHQLSILRTWPEVDATVTRSEVGHYSGKNGAMYQAHVEFRYRVEGRVYVAPADSDVSTSSYIEMARTVDRYGPGSQHRIRYNPAEPRDIRYTAGFNFGFFFLPLIFGFLGIIFSGIGLPMLISMLRQRRRAPTTCSYCSTPLPPGAPLCPACGRPPG